VVNTLFNDISNAITAIKAAPCQLVKFRNERIRKAEILISNDHKVAGITKASNFNLGIRKMYDCPPIILEKNTTNEIVVRIIEAIPFAFGPK
jgi:hypothetical protein